MMSRDVKICMRTLTAWKWNQIRRSQEWWWSSSARWMRSETSVAWPHDEDALEVGVNFRWERNVTAYMIQQHGYRLQEQDHSDDMPPRRSSTHSLLQTEAKAGFDDKILWYLLGSLLHIKWNTSVGRIASDRSHQREHIPQQRLPPLSSIPSPK